MYVFNPQWYKPERLEVFRCWIALLCSICIFSASSFGLSCRCQVSLSVVTFLVTCSFKLKMRITKTWQSIYQPTVFDWSSLTPYYKLFPKKIVNCICWCTELRKWEIFSLFSGSHGLEICFQRLLSISLRNLNAFPNILIFFFQNVFFWLWRTLRKPSSCYPKRSQPVFAPLPVFSLGGHELLKCHIQSVISSWL